MYQINIFVLRLSEIEDSFQGQIKDSYTIANDLSKILNKYFNPNNDK